MTTWKASSKLLASAAVRNRSYDLPKVLAPAFAPKLAGSKAAQIDLTSRHLFDTAPESVLEAAIDQIVQPRAADLLANGLRHKYAEVADDKFDHFDFHADHKEALATALTKIMQATKRTRVFHSANVVPEGLELVNNVEYKTFVNEVDGWSDDLALGAFHQKLSNSHPRTVAAVILSPFSSHNGLKPLSRDYVLGCQEICDRYGIQLIIDERHLGLGRTGPAFAFSNYENFQPDVLITTAPSTAFLPLTVVCSKTKRAPTSTDAHPVTLATANAAIKYFMDSNIPARTAEKSQVLQKGLQSLGSRAWVNGLCGGIELKEPAFASQTLNDDANIVVGQQLGGVNFQLPLLAEDAELAQLTDFLLSASASEGSQPWDASLKN